MLAFVGGAPRAGKGVVSRRCVERQSTALLSLDVLKMGLHHAAPELAIDPNTDSREVGEKMWPVVRAMAENVLESDLDYIFEGDMLLPRPVKELSRVRGEQVRACFLGYTDVDPAVKLAEIRKYVGLPNDWLNELADDYVLEVVEYGIRYSRELSEQCKQLDLLYIDMSRRFDWAVERAVEYLLGD